MRRSAFRDRRHSCWALAVEQGRGQGRFGRCRWDISQPVPCFSRLEAARDEFDELRAACRRRTELSPRHFLRSSSSTYLLSSWAELGFVATSIDYRLVGGSPAPAPYLDLLCAIRWMHADAEELRVDPDRIYLIGQSAGGHMVSLFATAGEGGHPRVGGWEKARTDVRAVISVAAAYESQYYCRGATFGRR